MLTGQHGGGGRASIEARAAGAVAAAARPRRVTPVALEVMVPTRHGRGGVVVGRGGTRGRRMPAHW